VRDRRQPPERRGRQAGGSASPGGHVELVAVVSPFGSGRHPMSTNHFPREQTALEDACRRAADVGASATWRMVAASDAADALVQECIGHDLIAVGSSGTSAHRSLFGTTASALVHGANVPVLIARHPGKASFPKNVVLASDASPASDRAATLAARIGSAHDANVTVVHVNGTMTATRWGARAGDGGAARGLRPRARRRSLWRPGRGDR
jgi:nucleotide-binding universal stress UspA family protein